MNKKITLEQLTAPIEGGYIPYIELLRSIGESVGEPTKRKYKKWSISHDGKSHFEIKNPMKVRTYSLFDENGDIDVYEEYPDGEVALTTTNGQMNLYRMYEALGINLPQSEHEDGIIRCIIEAKRKSCPFDGHNTEVETMGYCGSCGEKVKI